MVEEVQSFTAKWMWQSGNGTHHFFYIEISASHKQSTVIPGSTFGPALICDFVCLFVFPRDVANESLRRHLRPFFNVAPLKAYKNNNNENDKK